MSRTAKSVVYWLVLSPLLLVILFPFAVMISTAVKPRAEVLAYPPSWLPSEIKLSNFIEMWHATNFGTALTNSVVVSTGATLLASVPVAVVFSILQRYLVSGLTIGAVK